MGRLNEIQTKERVRQVNLLFGEIIDQLKSIDPTLPEQVIKHLQEVYTPTREYAALYIYILTAWVIIGDDDNEDDRANHKEIVVDNGQLFLTKPDLAKICNQLRRLQRERIKDELLSIAERIKDTSRTTL